MHVIFCKLYVCKLCFDDKLLLPITISVRVILQANLPLLQRELLHCARMAKQTPQQYLAHNDHILFDTSHSPVESQELVMSADINENGKRRASPDRLVYLSVKSLGL